MEIIDNDFKSNDEHYKPWGMDLKAFCLLLHLSQLSGYVIPFAGFILPIIMWQTNKKQSATIDKHGKNVINWIISSTVYGFGFTILSIIGIGVIGLIAIGICTVIFSILGAIKANEGIFYKYPLSIQFFK